MRALIRLCFCIATSIAALAAGRPVSAQYVMQEIDLRFPLEIAGAKYASNNQYKEPWLGNSVGYSAPQFWASLFVYKDNMPEVPTGIANQVMQARFDQARGDIAAYQMRKGLPAPQPVGEKTRGADGIEFLGATYSVMRDTTPELHYVGLTGYRGHFFKARLNVPVSSGSAGPAMIEKFIVGLARVMAAGQR